jgi:hypothetical protein
MKAETSPGTQAGDRARLLGEANGPSGRSMDPRAPRIDPGASWIDWGGPDAGGERAGTPEGRPRPTRTPASLMS